MHKPSWSLIVVALLGLSGLVGCSGSSKASGSTSGTSGSCAQNTDCPSTQRCTPQGCKDGCRADPDCPGGGVCHTDGTCGARPGCALDTDCATGFRCNAGVCNCSNDYACWSQAGGTPDTTQICVGGTCQASQACTADSQCTGGRYCGPAGVCTAPCLKDADCGGTSQFGALQCSGGRCTSPCVQDALPVGQGGCKDGTICTNNLCQVAQCTTFADCGDPTLYCTSAAHGHCAPFTVCNATQPDVCGPQANCQPYAPDACPPGFDCSLTVCVALPACLVDGQCQPDEICDLGVCRSAPACSDTNRCPATQDCIGGHCLTHVCRGNDECQSPQLCTAGRCQDPSTGADIVSVRLLTPLTTLEVGQVKALVAVALTATGAARPVAHFDWSVSPAGPAQVTGTGALTALAPGQATVSVGYTKPNGTHVTPDTSTFRVLAAPASGGRVVVVDSTSGAPLAGAHVRICGARDASQACTAAQDLVTGADGAVAFAPPSGPFDVSAAELSVDAQGRFLHDQVHLLGLTATDVLVPLPGNEAGLAAGFTGSVDFGQVKTTGGTNVALAGASLADLASFDLNDLLGQAWTSTLTLPTSIGGFGGLGGIPGGGLGGLSLPDGGSFPVQLTGGLVLDFTQIGGFTVPIQVKDTVYAVTAPGLRTGWAFAGKLNPQLILGSITSSAQNGALGAVLPFFGAFDHGLVPTIDAPLKGEVLDQSDLDGNGVCEDTNICATGGQRLPDYRHFPTETFIPSQTQSLRAEVSVAPLSGAVQTLLMAGAQVPGAGLVPLGLGNADATGQATVLRMAPVYGGLEVSEYAVLALAQGAGGNQPGQGKAPLSVQIQRSASLPVQVPFAAPFVPFVTGAGYAAATRQLTVDPSFSDVAAATQLVRLTVVGQGQRAFVYASPAALAAGLFVPAPVAGATYDPAADPSATATVVALALPAGDTLDGLASLSGDTLLDLSAKVTAFSRAQADSAQVAPVTGP
jgi:hypothetical protein